MTQSKVNDIKRGLKVEVEAAGAGQAGEATVLVLRDDRLPRALVTGEDGVVRPPRDLVCGPARHTGSVHHRGSSLPGTHPAAPSPASAARHGPGGRAGAALRQRLRPHRHGPGGRAPLRTNSWRGDHHVHAPATKDLLPGSVERTHTHRIRVLAGPVLAGPYGRATADTPLFRWPFSNVYGQFGGVREGACWYQRGQVETGPCGRPRPPRSGFRGDPERGRPLRRRPDAQRPRGLVRVVFGSDRGRRWNPA